MQQFVSQPVTYQQNSALGIQSLMPQAQSVVPQMGAQTLNLQSVAIPQAQSVVPSVVPQMQSVVPSVVPQVQSVVPSVVPFQVWLLKLQLLHISNPLEVDILLNKII